ncbi:twin-arginine translocation pathway signal [Mycolicibacillus parakoreensis]|uniref:Twin-arginine translocation pathway signal n=1 Tax=Mycolicibacillus parakoreensis TaxID=1069221 RepID=A0ABY3TW25_9MYCO|nr:twin-arginine translocation pathway signal [Mycolicibacillus parakoreensis]MCV7317082.1 twin-arginine translocation pathway signal [Mycolicibacillus parakoreensis]ULN51407.1 twin-arginine translocation pathway signal [Mycolicibacillus parakoreensis]
MNRPDPDNATAEPVSEPDQDAATDAPADPDATTDTADAPADADTEGAAAPTPAGRSRGTATRWIAVTLVSALFLAAALCCWLYFAMFRGDQQVGPEAEQAAMAAAADGATALLTYSPQTLDKDFAAAETHLTGDFLSYYTDFTENVVTPAAKEKDVQTVASVVRKGLINLDPRRAEVLIFVNQTTISKTNPSGSYTMSSVKVGLEKHDGRWLISSFDPV